MAPREPGGRRDRTGRGAPDGQDDARIHDRRWGGVRDIRWIPGPAPGRLDGVLPWPRASKLPAAAGRFMRGCDGGPMGAWRAVFPVSVSLPSWGLEAETSSGNGAARSRRRGRPSPRQAPWLASYVARLPAAPAPDHQINRAESALRPSVILQTHSRDDSCQVCSDPPASAREGCSPKICVSALPSIRGGVSPPTSGMVPTLRRAVSSVGRALDF